MYVKIRKYKGKHDNTYYIYICKTFRDEDKKVNKLEKIFSKLKHMDIINNKFDFNNIKNDMPDVYDSIIKQLDEIKFLYEMQNKFPKSFKNIDLKIVK